MRTLELRAYFGRFLELIPERIVTLTEFVRQSAGSELWEPNETPSSLGPLGNWFADQVKTRQRTDEEIRGIKEKLIFPSDVPPHDLTCDTIAIAADVGIYFGKTLLKNHPKLRWEQSLKNKNFADYGQPVIVGFGEVPLNPVRIAITLAYAITDGKQTGGRLEELYTYWENRAAKTN